MEAWRRRGVESSMRVEAWRDYKRNSFHITPSKLIKIMLSSLILALFASSASAFFNCGSGALIMYVAKQNTVKALCTPLKKNGFPLFANGATCAYKYDGTTYNVLDSKPSCEKPSGPGISLKGYLYDSKRKLCVWHYCAPKQ
jgi:hypothetical protein